MVDIKNIFKVGLVNITNIFKVGLVDIKNICKVGLVNIKNIFKVGLVEPARRAIHWMPSMIVERQVSSSSIYRTCDCFPLLKDSMNGQSIFSLGLSWKSRPSQRSRGNI